MSPTYAEEGHPSAVF